MSNPNKPSVPPGKPVDIHSGRIPKGKAGKKEAHGKKVGHSQHGSVTFFDADGDIPDQS